jgi:hypothetical protein
MLLLLHHLLVLVLVLLLGSSAANGVRVQVTVTHGLVKLRPGDAPPPLSADGLWAARNEYESLQVVITATSSTVVTGVAMAHPTLPSLGVAISRQNMINITQLSNCKCSPSWQLPRSSVRDTLRFTA